jgi:hypothetical protein
MLVLRKQTTVAKETTEMVHTEWTPKSPTRTGQGGARQLATAQKLVLWTRTVDPPPERGARQLGANTLLCLQQGTNKGQPEI